MLAVFAELAIFGMILFPQKRGVSALPSVSPPLSSFWSARWLGSAARNSPPESAAFRKKLAGRSRATVIQELLHKFLCETKPTTIYVQLLAEMGILGFGTMGGS